MIKTFYNYQQEIERFVKYRELDIKAGDSNIGWLYPVLGLGGEAGELQEKFKKILRDKNSKISEEDLELIKLELGDIGFYLCMICTELGIPFEEIFDKNVKKLDSREKRGKIQGSGDKR